MSGYENVNDFIVILADDRDPDVSWQNHLKRGSAGGVDCVAPMRTPVYAPCDGDLVGVWMGTGGLTARINQENGWRDELMHMDQVGPAGPVRQGDLIGYSGRSGGDYSPHVHWHRVDPDGQRRNPWHYFTSSIAGGGGELIPEPPDPDEEEPDMAKIIMRGEGSKEWSLVGPNGDKSGCRVTTVQATANAWARVYGPAIIIPTRDEYVKVQQEHRAIAKTWH